MDLIPDLYQLNGLQKCKNDLNKDIHNYNVSERLLIYFTD